MYSFREIISNLTLHRYDPPEKKVPSFMDLIVFITFIKDEIDLEINYGEQDLTIYFIFENHKVSITRYLEFGTYKVIKDFIVSVSEVKSGRNKTIASFIMRFIDRRNGLGKKPRLERFFFEGPECYSDICFIIWDLFDYMVDSHLKSLKRYHNTTIQNDGSV